MGELPCNSTVLAPKARRSCNRRHPIRFAHRVELFVGHEDDLMMGRWFLDLEKPTGTFPGSFDIEDDITSFMSHGQHVPPHVADPCPMPIVDDPAIVQGPHAQDAQNESSEEEEASDILSDLSEWHPTLIYSANRGPIPVRLDWHDYEGTYRQVAQALEIPVDRLLHLEQVHHRPEDLRRIQVEILLAYQFGDIPVGAARHATLIDVEFHNHFPSRLPEVVRRLCHLPTQLQRGSLLQGLGLGPIVADTRETSLIWHNSELCRQRAATWLHIADGDYLRIVIPPHPAECVSHINTKRIAAARFQGLSLDDILSQEVLRCLGWCPASETTDTAVPTEFDFDFHEDVSLLQLQSAQTPVDSTVLHHECKLNHDMSPLYAEIAKAQARERNAVQLTLNQQPAFIQALHLLWQVQGVVRQDQDGPQLRVHTWFLSLPHYSQCREARTATLDGDFQAWLQQLLDVWTDLLERNLPTDFHFVAPTPSAAPFQPRDEPHLILVQKAPVEGSATLITAVKPSHAGRPIDHMATFMPHIANKQDILTIAQLEMHCLPQVFALQCMIWHGDQQLQDQQQWQTFNGMSIEVIINPVPATDHTDPWDDDVEDVQLLQRHAKVRLSLETLLPEIVAVKLVSVHPGLVVPHYLEVPKGSDEAGIAAELRAWGISCRTLRFGQRDEYLVLPDDHCIPPDQHHYLLCHDDTHDTDGSIVHSHDTILDTPALMMLLCQLGYDRAAITAQEDLETGLHRVCFKQCQPQVAEKTAKVRQRTAWPHRNPLTMPRRPLFALQLPHFEASSCHVRPPFTRTDLHDLVHAGDGVLCNDFTFIDLPDYVKEALQPSADPFSHDRWLIYTDGSFSDEVSTSNA